MEVANALERSVTFTKKEELEYFIGKVTEGGVVYRIRDTKIFVGSGSIFKYWAEIPFDCDIYIDFDRKLQLQQKVLMSEAQKQSISKEVSKAESIRRDIAKQLNEVGIDFTGFRLEQYTKSSLSGDDSALELAIKRARNSIEREQNPITKPMTSLNSNDDSENLSVSYTEDEPGGNLGDDRDSFDYSDDYGDDL